VSVGETLREARETRGVSVEDVSAATRIRATLIRAIEADDYKPCGGAVYARGHIRSIARVVGVDPAPLIAEFDAAHQPEGPEQPTTAAVETTPAQTDRTALSRSDRRRGPNWAAAMAGALVLVVILAVIGLTHHNGSGNGTTASPPHSGASPSTSASSTPASPPPSAVAQLPTSADEATMLVRSTKGRTWLSVSDSKGGTLFQGILEQGHQKLFTAKHSLTFTIGNAAAVDVVVNGHDIGSPHAAGLVSRGKVIPGANTVQQT
jgi:cytoskeletal protein RodZ